MDSLLAFVVLVLGSIFVASFVILIILCRYKNLRRKTAVYVKRLARAELSRSDIELIDKSEKKTRVFRDSEDRLDSRCRKLLELCNSLDFSLKEISTKDIHDLHYIIEVARSITDESNSKGNLLENQAHLVLQVSKTMSRMEEQLKTVEEFSIHDFGDMIQI